VPYLSFRIARQWYGIHVDNVIEVMQMVYLSDMPAAAPDVLGVMNLREKVVPVIDLRIRFGITNPVLGLNTPIIGVNTPHGPVGLVVDDVDDVRPISPETLQPDRESPYVTHVATLDDRLLMLIDTAHLYQVQTSVHTDLSS